MLYVTHALNFLLMMALPLGLGFWLSRRLKTPWRLFGIGAVTFIASQVVHIPLLWGLTVLFNSDAFPPVPPAAALVFNAVVLGLAAGLCESLARYLVLRFWLKSARTWREALMFGAGHGGSEAIIFGALAGWSFLNLVALKDLDLATVVPADQVATLAQQVAAYWSTPWYYSLLGAVERVFALCLHLAAATLVLQALTRRNLLWLGAAVLWHALADGLGVFAAGTVGPYQAEIVIGALALASVVIIFRLRPRQPEPIPELAPAVVVSGAPPSPRAEAKAQADLAQEIDQSKYTG